MTISDPSKRETAPASNLVPGRMRCAKCNFILTRVNLYVQTGQVGAGDNKTEICGNGCGPMWPVTWEQEAREGYKENEALFDRMKAAEDELAVIKADREQRPAALSEAGSPMARMNWLMGELEKRFTDSTPFSSIKPPEAKYIESIDAMLADREWAITGEPVGLFDWSALSDGELALRFDNSAAWLLRGEHFNGPHIGAGAYLEAATRLRRAALAVPSEGIASVAASEPTREERAQWSKDFSNWAFYDEDLPRAIGLMDGSEAAHHAWFAAAKKYRAALVAASDESLSRQSSEAAESHRSTRNTRGDKS